MSAPRSEQLAQAASQYRKQFDELRETQRLLKEISCTVNAPRQTVSVTVGHGGAVRDIRFPSNAYKRMAPAELAKTVLKTITDAQQEAIRAAAALIAPTLPPGMNAEHLFTGDVDLQSLLPQESQRQDVTVDAMRTRG